MAASRPRTSRWDRPRPTRDVRWFIRLVGKTLITIGLLMFGFVAYQLWGTGLETARAQDRLGNELDELVAEASSTVAPTPTPTATPTPVVVTTTEGDAAIIPLPEPPSTSTTTASTVAETTTTVAEPVLDFGYVRPGGPVGQITIPSVGIDWTYVEGVSREDLKLGPGHYPQTPFPGELGNAAVAGHRTTYGGPFDHLPSVEMGADIVVTTLNGTYTYVATHAEVVGPNDGHVVATTDPTRATLTLTTCTPRGTASERYILYADLDPTRSDPVGPYVNRGAIAAGAELAGEDTTTTTTTTSTTTLAPTTTTVAAAVEPTVASTITSTTTTTTTTTTPVAETVASTEPNALAVPADPTADEDAFGDHWFDDRAAFIHVAIWGLLAAAVVIGAYQLAKSKRNSWIGLGVGVVPFVVTLYFFYQNVNRLLPAAL